MSGRDYRRLLAGVRCWDRECEELLATRGEALVDAALQNREELVSLCELIEELDVRSYLEIGAWTGRLVSALHDIFEFEKTAVCDHGWAERNGLAIELPEEVRFFRGDSDSGEFLRWREGLGHIDLTLIDADHSYPAVKRDFEIARGFPHRLIALHDIVGARRQTRGVRRFWEEIDGGVKREIIRPHAELGLDHSLMGIGVWSDA
jgi:hypothetical protein